MIGKMHTYNVRRHSVIHLINILYYCHVLVIRDGVGVTNWIYWTLYNSQLQVIITLPLIYALYRSLQHTKVLVRVRITLRLAIYRQSVRLGVNPLRPTTRDFFN
jgi:hypothetical protein